MNKILTNKLNNDLIKMIQQFNIRNFNIKNVHNELMSKTGWIRYDLEYYKYNLGKIIRVRNDFWAFSWE